MRILVTGITGGIGAALYPRLLESGHAIAALTRRADLSLPWVESFRGDAVRDEGLPQALRGVEVAYYLIHSMEPGAEADFADRERRAAENFSTAAAAAGVRRIVYLGGLVPSSAPSRHLESRLAVERILMQAGERNGVEVVALRASIVIASASRSFRFLVRVVERMPVLVLPSWRRYRTAPVDGRDVIAVLAAAAQAPQLAGRSLDLAGPDIVTYGQLIVRIRDLMILRRPSLPAPGPALIPLASRVAAVLTGEQHELVGPLMEGLTTDLLPRTPLASEVLGLQRHSLDAAIERALREWEAEGGLRAR